MEYQLTIKLDSAAFGDDPALELYSLLQQAAKRVLDHDLGDRVTDWEKVFDTNGNAVGRDRIAGVHS